MIEKIKTLDFVNMNEEDSRNLLIKLLQLNDKEFKECIIIILDSIDFNFFEGGLDTTKLNDFINNSRGFYKFIFDCDEFKRVVQIMTEEILDEDNKNDKNKNQ
jgi:archaellum biogenesis ATPase FlaH